MEPMVMIRPCADELHHLAHDSYDAANIHALLVVQRGEVAF
jgi:hypothetical protein